MVPDIVLPSVDDHFDTIGEDKLDNPLEYDTIPSASFEKLNRVQPYLWRVGETLSPASGLGVGF